MFQTEIILFLQTFESAFLNALLGAVNSTGYSEFYVPLLIVILFGISFRKGFYLLHVLLWTGLTTTLLKEHFALPRPCDVDLNVKLPGSGHQNATRFDGMGARRFWGALPAEAVAFFRDAEDSSHGLPSGHVSTATALWTAISQLFRQPWVRWLAIAIVALMPITRMYLGRHFLADVLGGLLVGGFFALAFYYFVYRSKSVRRVLSQSRAVFAVSPWSVALLLAAAARALPGAVEAHFARGVYPRVAGFIGEAARGWAALTGTLFYFAYSMGRILGLFSRTYRKQLDFEI